MKLKPYPKYKGSGVEWLGDVPEGWTATLLKRGYSVTLGKMLQPDSKAESDTQLPYIRAANIQWGGVDVSDIKEMWISASERESLLLTNGDLLVSEGGDVGRSAIWNGELKECYFQNSINRIRPQRGNFNKFLYFWICAVKDAGFIDILCNKSTIAHFTAEKVQALPVALPSPAEQIAIATFLDRETAKLDTLIAKQEKLIELLQEKRQAVISHAVTKGLDPDVPMKDSGVEWLGEVPDGWMTLPLRYVASSTGSVFIDGDWIESKDISDDGIRYITTGNVGEGVYKEQGSGYITEEKFVELNCTEVRPGDVLISRLNLPIGRACLVPDLGCKIVTSVDNVITRTADYVFPNFLVYLLSSKQYFAHTEILARGTTMQRISRTILGNIRICLPKKVEQVAIATHLDHETSKIDRLIEKAQRFIELAKEYRTALISAAVTGKIDVREAA